MGGPLTVQREEQQRRQRGAPTSHPGAAGSAPAARPAPRRSSRGAGRALGALGAAGTSQTSLLAAVRPAGLGRWDLQTRQARLPRRPAPQRLSCAQVRPGLAGLAPRRHGHLALPRKFLTVGGVGWVACQGFLVREACVSILVGGAGFRLSGVQ